jgi:hypothetical protein
MFPHEIEAFNSAKTVEEARDAFEALVHIVACDEELPDDADFESGAEAWLNSYGLPDLSGKLHEIAMASL